MSDTLRAFAAQWIDEDPDAATAAAGRALLEGSDLDALKSHFGTRLAFGTAGLRGALGPGPNRMNRALVIRVAAAVGIYVLKETADAAERGIVVGYDGRHGSVEFAADTVEILGGLGFRVYAFDGVIPTPRLAHAVKHLNAAAGIMVTASHNPPEDNGYKVYWGDAAQIVPPHDLGISREIDALDSIASIPRATRSHMEREDRLLTIPAAVHASYAAEVDALRVYDGPTQVRIVYSAMHGVGRSSVEQVLTSHGYTDLHVVEEQADPDPDFSTVSFPNPEEPGAMDLSLALAERVKADLVLANDPDADRLCVAVPHGDGFRLLTGNDVGVLIADELLAYGEYVEPLVATTIVSTSLLEKIARHYGASYGETLTGFKWIAERAVAHQRESGHFVMGFEEALGYSIGHVVRDKDGVSAALIFADIAARCRSLGKSLLDRLSEIYRRHGLHLTKQVSMKRPGEAGQAEIGKIMDYLRENPPQFVGDYSVVETRDIQLNRLVNCVTGEIEPVGLPTSNVLGYRLDSGARIMVRPSGTEPKIKFYFEVCELFQDQDAVSEVERRAQRQLTQLEDAFMALIDAR
jgi:phosphomannomutase